MPLISIIGLPRSGTTALGRALSAAEGVAYHEEPNPLWRFRNWARLGHEQFCAEHATPEVCRQVRKVLVPKRPDSHYVIEKTPSNSLRVGFVEAVVPEARLVFITRRGEDIRRSMLRKWISGDDSNATRLQDAGKFREIRGKFAKLRYVHPREFPLYFAAEVGARSRYANFWGPQFEGWQAFSGGDPEFVVDASCTRMEEALTAGILACRSRHTVIAYEDLVNAPSAVLNKAMAELGCNDLDLSRGLRFFDQWRKG